ncbi:hypothetical protein [Marinimicrobium sp. ABcell2]|uniref:hypothetical protein n=1 Tax=Marinimicrobium sp. ABcell2 TaxID=3069751 RepID=UPI0027B36DD2|nr:hypothetical protein [Marinimicrobium sp. ABcell2]MDQ2076650.1 hypothetical protein [Marinimicrobium sp. ABcell2]
MRWLRPFVCLLAGAVASVGASASEDDLADAELRYGVALYHYYQQNYLDALSELMIAQRRGGISTQGRNPLLIEGGVRLAFGMPESAGALFEQVLDDHRTPAQREAAWFYLGKLHYLRAQWPEAQARFEQAGTHLQEGLDHERRALLVNLQIRAEQPLAALNPRRVDLGHWSPYVLYNLGAAEARAGNYSAARDYYAGLLRRAPSRDGSYRDEHLALRDKALTGAGYSFLLEGNYPAAVEQFQRVRLNHSEANQALLGYGWAAVAAGDYQAALRPWQALSERSLIHPPVQEALLALPYAYQQLGSHGAALNAYDRAETQLEWELNRVAGLRRDLNSALLRTALNAPESTLVSIAPAGEHNWLTLDRASVIDTDSSYLAELFRENSFQTGVQAARDLLQQRKLLEDWLPKLSIYGDMLREKRQLRQDREQQLTRESVYARAADLHVQREALTRELERVRHERDYMTFADPESWELWTMVQRAELSRQRLAEAGQDVGDAQERLRLFRGMLLWDAAQAFPDRVWRSEKTRRQLDTALSELQERGERVRRITETDFDIAPSLARLTENEARIRAQVTALDLALEEHLENLAEQVQVHLAAHEGRLNHYLARTRLAAAQLQDQALREARR